MKPGLIVLTMLVAVLVTPFLHRIGALEVRQVAKGLEPKIEGIDSLETRREMLVVVAEITAKVWLSYSQPYAFVAVVAMSAYLLANV